ncbi:MAG: SAM-dependent methyltransferase [Chloroflexi bacterium]|nr:SAM-dependent methyltransferase [Chloroflexota bacterium]
MSDAKRVEGSFRDPSGFVFLKDGVIYRQVNKSYQQHYDLLKSSGLYDRLISRNYLVPHTEVDHPPLCQDDAYKILRPQRIPFISYPYEWSFSQVKDAALVTLSVLKRSLAHGLILKDASAYNVQFLAGKPLLIDTLSFETYQEGQPWHGYRQFCQHFLAPLALMSYRDIRLSRLLREYIDGIPLDLAVSLFPRRSYLNVGLVTHLHLHARAQQRYAGKPAPAVSSGGTRLGKRSLMNIADNLQSTIERLSWDPGKTSWSDYYAGDSYQETGFDSKVKIVASFIREAKPRHVWDLGANTGVFSRVASQSGIFTVSIDSDPGAVEANYLFGKQRQEENLHPLLVDLTNPTGASGWANSERESLVKRSRADCILALALIHHLAIANNVRLDKIARFFASLAEWAIVEFVPKSDKKVQQLLVARDDIFIDYTRAGFEREFGSVYDVQMSAPIENSQRLIYLLRRRQRA